MILRAADAGVDAPRPAIACVALAVLLPTMATTGAWTRLFRPADPATWLRGGIEAWLKPRLGLRVALAALLWLLGRALR